MDNPHLSTSAFVDFNDTRDAEDAVNALNGAIFSEERPNARNILNTVYGSYCLFCRILLTYRLGYTLSFTP
jgi:hypothetical protein